jgi:hypothetical protein
MPRTGLGASLAAAAADHPDSVDIEQDRGRARVLRRLGIENGGVPERERSRVDVFRMLVEQESEVSGRAVSRANRQQHRRPVQYRRK